MLSDLTTRGELLAHLGSYDAIVTTVLAAGGTRPATAQAGEDDGAWDVAALAALDIPILQGLCLTWGRAEWEASDDGMSPLDVATQVAVPEFDGRIITTAFSFKETGEDGIAHYVADPERCERVAGIALGHARLRHTPASERKIAVILSAYPTKHARIGNAVGLDTPVSTIRLLRAMRDAGYDLGAPGDLPGLDPLWRLLAVTGFLGALTTFSTFSAEVLGLLLQGRAALALGVTLAHVLGSLAAAWLGLHSGTWLMRGA